MIKLYNVLLISAMATVSLVACNNNQQTAEVKEIEQPAEINEVADNMNTLTAEEERENWKLLFDGKTTAGWRGAYSDSFPEHGWLIENGELVVLKSDGAESRNGGDIITVEQFGNFELVLEAKLTPGANSGVKYFVTERLPKSPGSAIGLEFQLLDDDLHPDAKMGKDGNRTIASLYDLITARNKEAKPIGEWNKVRIVSKDNHVEHWLNGTKVLEYERGSPEFRKLVAGSKYKDFEGFGESPKGHILLQDHGDEVRFRNIKLRELDSPNPM